MAADAAGPLSSYGLHSGVVCIVRMAGSYTRKYQHSMVFLATAMAVAVELLILSNAESCVCDVVYDAGISLVCSYSWVPACHLVGDVGSSGLVLTKRGLSSANLFKWCSVRQLYVQTLQQAQPCGLSMHSWILAGWSHVAGAARSEAAVIYNIHMATASARVCQLAAYPVRTK